MRLLLLILFVGTVVLADEKTVKSVESEKVADAKDAKTSVVSSSNDVKSKTEKRDSSDQTGSYFSNPNDEPFRPIIGIGNSDIYEAAAASHQATYYDKNQLTVVNEAGGGGGGGHHPQHQEQFTAHDALTTKDATINRQAVSAAYQGPYSQVVYQQQQQQQQQHQQHPQQTQEQQQQQQLKQFIRNGGKHNGIPQKNILYAQPPTVAYNYERLPGQQQHLQLQQQQQQQQKLGKGLHNQQVQYVIAIPMSYLRQLQQQLFQQQQLPHQQHTHVQPHKGGQQQQQQQQQQRQQPQQPLGEPAHVGPLARDHQGSYRPFHRFGPLSANEAASINAAGQPHYPNLQHAPAPPGYITQYIQIPASVLLEAAQSAQVYQRPLPQQVAYDHQHQQQQQQLAQSHSPGTAPQYYYYYPSQQQQQQEELRQSQQQLKHAQPSHGAASPPLYAYQVQQQQPLQYLQQPLQHQVQHPHNLHSEAQLQQLNVGKQQQHQLQRGEGTTVHRNLGPPISYQHEPLVTYAPQTQQHTNAHSQPAPITQTHNPHNQQQHQQQPAQPAQVLTVPQAQKPGNAHSQQVAAAVEPSFEPIVHYNPQYLVQYLQPQHQLKYQQSSQPLHQHHLPHGQPQAQAQRQRQLTLDDNLNNLPYSQGIHGPTPVPYLRLSPAVPAVAPAATNPYAIAHPFVASALQPAFPPLGIPSKVTSFSNVLLQPFVGHAHAHAHPAYQASEIGAMGNAMPYFNQVGGIHYGTHLFHPPTPPTPLANKQDANVVPLSPAAAAVAATSAAKGASAKTTEGSRTIVKYP